MFSPHSGHLPSGLRPRRLYPQARQMISKSIVCEGCQCWLSVDEDDRVASGFGSSDGITESYTRVSCFSNRYNPYDTDFRLWVFVPVFGACNP